MSRSRSLAALVGVATLALAGIVSPALADATAPTPLDAVSTDEPAVVSTAESTLVPAAEPTVVPADESTAQPTAVPTDEPTAVPTDEPTAVPTDEPTAVPTDEPTVVPTDESTALISVDVSSVPAGGEVTITATGFMAGESVDVYLHSTPVHLTTITSDGSGKVIVKVTIPTGTAPGVHNLVLTGQRSGVSLQQAITVTAPVNAPATGPRLAATGVSVLPLLLAGSAVLGGSALVARRRTTN